MAELVESYGVFAVSVSSISFKFKIVFIPHAFCFVQNKTSPAQSLRKGLMQRLKFMKASEVLVCQAQEKKPQTSGCSLKPLSISFLLFLPLYHPMLISSLSYEEMCFKMMLDIDVQINSMNICMLLPNTLFMLFYHFTEMRCGLSLEKFKGKIMCASVQNGS